MLSASAADGPRSDPAAAERVLVRALRDEVLRTGRSRGVIGVSGGLDSAAALVLAARALGYRGFAKLVRGGSAPEQALMKAFCSEAMREACLVGAEVTADHAADVGGPGHRREAECSWVERYYISFGSTISAGTSEIQRNIIAERVLGLPRG